MSGDFPAPLTPAGCDLRGYDFMPSFGQRLFSSTFYGLALRNPRAGLAGIKLWWEAWVQKPAASLPDDDFDLARLADFGGDINAWLQVKETALHGFIKCSDGRLYHRFLATQAIDAYDRRLKAGKKREGDRARLQAWRDARKRDHTGDETLSETRDETRFLETSETRDDTRFVAGRQGQGQGQRIEDSFADFAAAKPASEETSRKSKSSPKDWIQNDEFLAFRKRYPKNDKEPGRTYTAWLKALKIAQPAEIMTGLTVHPFNPDEKFRPDPAKWLNGQSWRADAAQSNSAPALMPKPVKRMSGCLLSDDDMFLVPT